MNIYTIKYDNDCCGNIIDGVYLTPYKAFLSYIKIYSDNEVFIKKYTLNETNDYILDPLFKFVPAVQFNLVKNLEEFKDNKNIIIQEAVNEKYDMLHHLFIYKNKRNIVYEERRKAIIDKNNGLNLKINDHTDIYEKIPFPKFKIEKL